MKISIYKASKLSVWLAALAFTYVVLKSDVIHIEADLLSPWNFFKDFGA
jgi:hypothetical protein